MPSLSALQQHKVYTAQLTVVSRQSGVAKFDDGQNLPEALTRDGYFRSKSFSSYNDGDIVSATFRVSGTNRHLQTVQPISAIKNQPFQAPANNPVVLPVNREGEFINGIFFNAKAMTVFKAIDRLAVQTGAASIVITGASGYGKTSMARAFAEKTGRKFQRFDCQLITDTEEWFGYRETKGGDTIFVTTEFTDMLREGNCVILLDEYSRLEPWVSNSLLPLFDDTRATTVHGERIELGPNVVFVKTMNLGYEYVGTFSVDRAQMNRNDAYLEVGPMPSQYETQLLMQRAGVKRDVATQIVNMMFQLRKAAQTEEFDVDITTRSSLKIAYLMMAGMHIRQAFEFAIVISSVTSRKSLTDVLNTKFGAFDDGYTETF